MNYEQIITIYAEFLCENAKLVRDNNIYYHRFGRLFPLGLGKADQFLKKYGVFK